MPGGSRVDLLASALTAPQAPASLRDGNYLGQGVDVHIRLVKAFDASGRVARWLTETERTVAAPRLTGRQPRSCTVSRGFRETPCNDNAEPS